MATYKSSHTGGQVDTAVNQVLNNNVEVQWGKVIGTMANQTDLNTALNAKADAASTSTALDARELVSNKVTSLSSASTDLQYPSAKLVYNKLEEKAQVDFSNLDDTGKDYFDWKYGKSIEQKYKLYDEAEGYELLEKQKRSTFDKSKFTIEGSPTITDDGIASGFSSSNYLTIPNTIDFSKPWKIITKFIMTSTGEQMLWEIQGGGWFDYIYSTGSNLLFTFKLSDGTEKSLDTQDFYTLQLNTEYIYKVGWTGEQYYINLYDADMNLLVELYLNSELTLNITDAKVQLGFGSSGYYSLTGSIDLSQFSITVDGEEVFNGNKTGVDQIKKDDYTLNNFGKTLYRYVYTDTSGTSYTVYADSSSTPAALYNSSGSLYYGTDFTVSNSKIYYNGNECTYTSGSDITYYATLSEDGILSGLSGSDRNYLITPLKTQTDFTIEFEFKMGNTPITEIGSQLLALTLGMYTSQNLSAWDIYYPWNTTYIGSIKKKANSTFFVRINKTGLVFTIDYSIDGIWEQTQTTTLSSETTISHSALEFGSYLYGGNKIQIDLNKIKYYDGNGNLIYQPTLRIPYTQSKTGNKIVDNTYRDRVQQMYDDYGYTPYYTLGTEPEKYYVDVVGSPTLSGGVATFTYNSYLSITTDIDITKKIDFYGEFTYKADSTKGQTIFAIGSYRVTSYKNMFNIAGDGKTGTTTLIEGETYKYKVTLYNGNTYVYLLIDDEYSLELTTSSAFPTANVTSVIIGANTSFLSESDNRMWQGSIDLSQFSITVDGEEVFHGYDPAVVDAYTLNTVENNTVVDYYENGINQWEQKANLTVRQQGACTSGTPVTLLKPYKDTNYALSVPYSAKTATGFTPTQTGDFIADGKIVLG